MPRQLDLRLALPATAAWLGAWVGLDAPVPAVVACCGVVSVVGVLAWRRRRFAAAAAGLCLVAGLAVAALRVVALHLGPLDELAAQRAVASADLVITSDPRGHPAATHGADRGRELFVVPARAEAVTARGRIVKLRSALLVLAGDPAWADLLPGQRVVASGRLSQARPGQSVAAVLHVSGPPQRRGAPPLVQRAAGDLRLGLRRSVAGLPPGERGLVPGLVLGDTARMPPDLTEDFRTAGLTHLSTSGSHGDRAGLTTCR